MTGLIPGAAILLLMPFVPESGVWKRKKQEGTLKRAGFGELFSRELRRTTIVTTMLSACGYAAAFGAIQMTPLQIVAGPARYRRARPPAKPVKDAEAKLEETRRRNPGTRRGQANWPKVEESAEVQEAARP